MKIEIRKQQSISIIIILLGLMLGMAALGMKVQQKLATDEIKEHYKKYMEEYCTCTPPATYKDINFNLTDISPD